MTNNGLQQRIDFKKVNAGGKNIKMYPPPEEEYKEEEEKFMINVEEEEKLLMQGNKNLENKDDFWITLSQ